MSLFAVTVQRITNIRKHPNADRLELASLENFDFEFVVQKGVYDEGDLVVYFPVDSLLPMPLVEELGLVGKLAHGKINEDGSPRLQNRVKTIKLRGQISQGVVAPYKLDFFGLDKDPVGKNIGMDLTRYLSVEKYEPPVQVKMDGILKPLPQLVKTYDIESFQYFIDDADDLLKQDVYITEKVEGMNCGFSWDGNNFSVFQRNYSIEEVEGKEHNFWKWAREKDIENKIKFIANWLEVHGKEKVRVITLRGEWLGPGSQGNYYALKENNVLFFEIEVNGFPIDVLKFLEVCHEFGLETVPVIGLGINFGTWLNGQTIKEASNGISMLTEKDLLREGIVVRPMTEMLTRKGERLILKQRSPEYLLESDF